jgi:hypothetical protein
VCAVNNPRSIPTGDAWLTAMQAAELLLNKFQCSEGRAERLLRDAMASGDVRLQERTFILTSVSGEGVWYTNRLGPEAANRRGLCSEFDPAMRISGHDLIAWILTQKPVVAPGRRYATDNDLVSEGVKGIRAGTWPNANKAATDLAPRAEGNVDAATDRLRRKIRAALGT